MIKLSSSTMWVILVLVSFGAGADAPNLKSGTPVIFLADNLDEKDQLGWCIDTEGRGFAEKLQSHSCKPKRQRALDTQFDYEADSGQIRSVAFAGKCMTFKDPDNKVWPFWLQDCVSGDASQQFVYDSGSMELRIGSNPSKCVVVAPASIAAGPFMSRDLLVDDCRSIDTKFKQWVINK